MLGFMLDTDTSSYLINGSEPGVDRRIHKIAVGESCISVITKGELLFGVAASPQRERTAAKVETFLSYMQVLDLPSAVAEDYGIIRAELKRRGTPIGANDLWIAAHARHLGLTLVTNNVREFSRVPELKIENWAETA